MEPQEELYVEKEWEYEDYYNREANVDDCNEDNEDPWDQNKYLGGYKGKTFHHMMHGEGIYKWTRYGKENVTATYEGHFYDNKLNGYGTMSFCDGTVFNGVYKNDSRMGPGIESQVCLSANIGLWSSNKLIRLAWSPEAIIPNLTTTENGNDLVNKHRIKLIEHKEILNNNEKLEDLEEEHKERKIIAKEHDIVGVKIDIFDDKHTFNYKELFDAAYYEDVKVSLVKYNSDNNEIVGEITENIYYAWNNSDTMLDIMTHCYEHCYQIPDFELNLTEVLSGPRNKMKAPGVHELNCRTLLMASYLGHCATVADLVSKKNVHPNVADICGNTALMYAVFSDNIELIDFLIEAGAHINDVNDSCCSALTIALVRYLTVKRGISINNIHLLVPPEKSRSKFGYTDTYYIKEWKLNKHTSLTKLRSQTHAGKHVKRSNIQLEVHEEYTKLDQCDIDKRLYAHILEEYKKNVEVLKKDGSNITESIFQCSDLIAEIIFYDDYTSSKKNGQTKKTAQVNNDVHVDEEKEKIKNERLYHIKQVVKHLLIRGANPNVDGPLPALLIAIAANSVDLVKVLLKYGADLHETYSEVHNYTPLEIALARPLSLFDNSYFCIIFALLKHGADINQRMLFYAINEEGTPIKGPTLLHAVVAKVAENEQEINGQRKLLKLFLDYNVDVAAQFKDRTVIDHVMVKNRHLIETFVNHPKVDLNVIINDRNETMLGKLFETQFFKSLDRTLIFRLINDLLKHGADPLLPYNYDGIHCKNVITYAREKLFQLIKARPETASKIQEKSSNIKPPNGQWKLTAELIDNYNEAVDVISRHGTKAHTKWIQSVLLKELAIIVNRFKHRSWHLIIKEHKRKKAFKIWLNTTRSLEICLLLRKHKKLYQDKKVINLLLCIAEYYSCHKTNMKLTAREKSIIEDEVNELLSGISTNVKTQSYKMANKKLTAPEKEYIEKDVKELLKDFIGESVDDCSWKKNIVPPELDTKKEKFEVCFECSGPFTEDCILCSKCKMISFCSMDCFKTNTFKMDFHPCSSNLIHEFSPAANSMDLDVDYL